MEMPPRAPLLIQNDKRPQVHVEYLTRLEHTFSELDGVGARFSHGHTDAAAQASWICTHDIALVLNTWLNFVTSLARNSKAGQIFLATLTKNHNILLLQLTVTEESWTMGTVGLGLLGIGNWRSWVALCLCLHPLNITHELSGLDRIACRLY